MVVWPYIIDPDNEEREYSKLSWNVYFIKTNSLLYFWIPWLEQQLYIIIRQKCIWPNENSFSFNIICLWKSFIEWNWDEMFMNIHIRKVTNSCMNCLLLLAVLWFLVVAAVLWFLTCDNLTYATFRYLCFLFWWWQEFCDFLLVTN